MPKKKKRKKKESNDIPQTENITNNLQKRKKADAETSRTTPANRPADVEAEVVANSTLVVELGSV